MFDYPLGENLRHLRLGLKNPRAVLNYLFRRFMWQSALGTSNAQTISLYKELYDNNSALLTNLEQRLCIHMRMKRQPELYVLCRLLKPCTLVETGVEHGLSSTFILLALQKNKKGVLYSIDAAAKLKCGRRIGWLVPEHLRQRWKLTIGNSTKILPQLLRSISPIDVFLHDSEHTYLAMTDEYNASWPHLKRGGVMLSDDTGRNEAFIDFCKTIRKKPAWTPKEYGIVIK